MVSIPYIKGLSEKLKGIINRFNKNSIENNKVPNGVS